MARDGAEEVDEAGHTGGLAISVNVLGLPPGDLCSSKSSKL